MRRLFLAAAIAIPGILTGWATPAGAGGAIAGADANPFVGSWESFDDFDDGEFQDFSHVRVQFGNGQFHIRDEAANGCRRNGFGFVPATLQGTGEVVIDDEVQFHGSGDLYCYPRDRRGRSLLVDELIVSYEYDDFRDVFYSGSGQCFWRTGTGDASDCE